MKILLFGEYSGLFNCLKDGLISLGHDVFLASGGDYYRNYPSDYRWDAHIKGKMGQVAGIYNVFTHLNKFKGFDIVLLISSFPLFRKFFNDRIFKFLLNNNNKVYLSGAGLTPFSFDFWHQNIESKYYHYTEGEISAAAKRNKKFNLFENHKLKQSEIKLFNKLSGYIPIMYEYAEPYRNFSPLVETIPIPINLTKLSYAPNLNKGKIVFFHGLTKECKGGEYILKAFSILEKKYPNDAQFFAKGGLPFDEYMQIIGRTNVVLDDVNAYSLGMNGLFSMAKGKIVMGGVEEDSIRELKYSYCPAYNLKRDVKQIITQIEKILDNKTNIEELGHQSRAFVEKYHDHIMIAARYVEVWNKNI